MSKTVKRAMRVMMVGLVALLGANAEAHYYVAAGKYKYCSLHCVVDLKNVPDPISNPAEVRCEATATLAEILCPDQSLVQLPVNWVLVGQGPIDLSNWKLNGKATVQVGLPIPLDDLPRPSQLCDLEPPDLGWKPAQGDVKILEMPTAEIRVCPEPPDLLGLDLPDLCPIAPSTDTFYNCEIDSGSPRGTFYTCDTQTIDHLQ